MTIRQTKKTPQAAPPSQPIHRICPTCHTLHPGHCPHHPWHGASRATSERTANTPQWRRLAAQAKARDNHRCRQCGNAKHLTVHLNPALHGNHLTATLRDCLTLCATCHGAHDAPRARGFTGGHLLANTNKQKTGRRFALTNSRGSGGFRGA